MDDLVWAIGIHNIIWKLTIPASAYATLTSMHCVQNCICNFNVKM